MTPAAGSDPASRQPSLAGGRLCIALAALFWSTSGAFTKVLTQHTSLGLDLPPVLPLQIAFYRVLFAAVILAPTLRRRDLSWRGAMLGMVLCFTVMNALFVTALAQGTVANTILLQYTAPMWMYLASVWWLGEAADRRSGVALAIGLCGIGVIVAGGWRDAQLANVALAFGSGLAYAGVMIFLRLLRSASSRWLTVLNHLGAALALVPLIWTVPQPTWAQLGVLFLYGAVQMGLPYWLVARGLRSVSPQEAGTITLLEPLLNPVWAYLVSPGTEAPTLFTWVGGAFVLVAATVALAGRNAVKSS